MKKIIFLFVCVSTFGCAQDKIALQGKTEFQRELNAEYKDASKSPLKDKDRKNFRGLDFFEVDSAYVVTAILQRTPNSSWFGMKTTTKRLSRERIYGILSFVLKGETYKLNVYQGQDIIKKEGYEDYLFLPFIDQTNGDTSYGGGRYIDLRIPKGNTISIDFNTAYNPYCAYNDTYSCPIVPRVNYVPIAIKAGVMAFGKH